MREIKWTKLTLGAIDIAKNWIDCVERHNGARFYLQNWPANETKESVVLRFVASLARAKRLVAPLNMVVFLDYDSWHARERTQNAIREIGQIARCYHVDSARNDCIQACDLLLGALCTLKANPLVRSEHAALGAKLRDSGKLTGSESRRFIAGYLAQSIDAGTDSIRDLTSDHS